MRWWLPLVWVMDHSSHVDYLEYVKCPKTVKPIHGYGVRLIHTLTVNPDSPQIDCCRISTGAEKKIKLIKCISWSCLNYFFFYLWTSLHPKDLLAIIKWSPSKKVCFSCCKILAEHMSAVQLVGRGSFGAIQDINWKLERRIILRNI